MSQSGQQNDLSYSEENPTSVMGSDAVAPEEVSFLSEKAVELASAIKSKADDSDADDFASAVQSQADDSDADGSASAVQSQADGSEHGEDDDFSYDFDFETVPNEDPFSDAVYARFAAGPDRLGPVTTAKAGGKVVKSQWVPIPVEDRDSETAKLFMGTQWKSAQMFVTLKNGSTTYLPRDYSYKANGVNLRVKLDGAGICPRLRIEATVSSEDDASRAHKAYLDFNPYDDIVNESFKVVDHVARTRPKKPKRKGANETGPEPFDQQNSNYAISFRSMGGTGYGLDHIDSRWDHETKQTLAFLRRLSRNLVPVEGARHVHFRISVRRADSDSAKVTRTYEQFIMLQETLQSFDEKTRSSVRMLPWHQYRALNGTPQTQWNSWHLRPFIQEQGHGLIQYPSKISFASTQEAAIVLAYAVHMEYERELQQTLEICQRNHRVGFARVGEDAIVAVIHLSLDENQTWFRFQEGSLVKIAFSSPTNPGPRSETCMALAVPNVYLPSQTNSTFVVVNKGVEFFADFAVDVGRSMTWVDCKLHCQVPSNGAQRQVDAINRLCGVHQPLGSLLKWQKLLLNQSAGARDIYDPTACLKLPSSEVDHVINGVLDSCFDWAAGQRKCIQACRKFPERLLMIEGFPGTGKTFTLAAMAAIYLQLGMHVLVCTPSHSAGDAFCDAMDRYNAIMKTAWIPLRVYRPTSEFQTFKSADPNEPEAVETHDPEHGEGDESAGPVDTSESIHEDIDKDQAETTQKLDDFHDASGQVSDGAPAQSNDSASMSPVAQGLLLGLAQAARKTRSTRHYRRPDKSLEARVIQEANSGRQCIGHYPSDEQVAISKGFRSFDEIEFGSGIPLGDEADMSAEVKKYLQKLKEEPLGKWDPVDKNKAMLSFKKVAEKVVGDARLVVSTNNNAGSSIVASHFGSNSNGVIIIRDEDPKEVEPNSWVSLARLKSADKVAGIVVSGDRRQLLPTVLSSREKPCVNEFALQLETSFAARAWRMKHPVIKLTEQRRFRPVFTQFLNERVYGGRMGNHPCTASLSVNPKWDSMLRSLLDINPATEVDAGYLNVSVDGSTCRIHPGSKSRYNTRHVNFVVKLIIRNFEVKGYDPGDIRIIVPYSEQELRYKQAFFKLTADGELPLEAHPKICTANSSQGQESKVVILDWVISSADNRGDLGFTADDNQCNVAQSRMMEVMINIIPDAVGSGTLSNARDARMNSFGDVITPKVPYPCAFVQWANRRMMTVSVASDPDADEGADPTSGPWNDEAAGRSWEAEPASGPSDVNPASSAFNAEAADAGSAGNSWNVGLASGLSDEHPAAEW